MAGGPAQILLEVLVVLVGAKLGGEAAERLRQPAVLGEILVGILLGSSLLGGFIGMPDFSVAGEAGAAINTGAEAAGPFFVANYAELADAQVLALLGTLGVVLLLFEVGLESNVKELTKVGASSLLVALIGIVISFAVGYGASWGLAQIWSPWGTVDDRLGDNLLHVFVGAALTATSVGITARVLADMGRLRSAEARIILGAAVLDDIGGLLILAVVAALVDAAISGGSVSALDILEMAGKAFGFLLVSIVVGLRLVPPAFDWATTRMRIQGATSGLAFAFALLMAYLATLVGLADIVGAFAAGLVLAQAKTHHRIVDELRPVAALLVGFFFVTLGMRVDLTRMEGHGLEVVAVGLALSVLAILAKLACGWGVVRTPASRLVVGVGMAPRGEVGLIFAALGLSTGLLVNWQYTTIVIVVLVTTFVTPLWLKRLQGAFRGGDGPVHSEGEHMAEIGSR